MTRETICTYEQSNRLKGLGFDWPCQSFYHINGWGKQQLNLSKWADNFNAGANFSASTQQVAHRWLRENVQILIVIKHVRNSERKIYYNYSVYYLQETSPAGWSYDLYDSYEEAMSKALDYAIECAVIKDTKQQSNTQ